MKGKKWLVGFSLALLFLGVSLAQGGKLEIFSWWTTGGEAAGLLKLFDIYKQEHPGVKIINAAVAGGAGSNAKAVLKTRMLGGDPPDSFQVHMGHELIDTWVTTGFMEPLDEIYQKNGWEKVFPKGVLDLLKWNGHYWSVPANIHRANVLWYNKAIFIESFAFFDLEARSCLVSSRTLCFFFESSASLIFSASFCFCRSVLIA